MKSLVIERQNSLVEDRSKTEHPQHRRTNDKSNYESGKYYNLIICKLFKA